jgi:hypothetical protein
MVNKGLKEISARNKFKNFFKDKHEYYIFEGYIGTYHFKFNFDDFTYVYVFKKQRDGKIYLRGQGLMTSLHINIYENLIISDKRIYEEMKSKANVE